MTVSEAADAAGSPPLPVRISVHEDAVVKPFSPTLFGMNFDWEGAQAVFFAPGAATPDASPVNALLKGIRFPLNRMSGSDSQTLSWKNAVGAAESRPGMKLWPWSTGKPLLFGPVEWISWLRGVDPDSAITWTVNLTQPASEARDLAEFFVGDAAAMAPPGRTNWAARRAELGLAQPVRVAIWELGNEMDWGSRQWTVDRYIDACRSAMAAIRSVDPGAKFAVHAKTAPYQTPKTWRAWHQSVLKALGSQVDYVAFHPYYYGLSLAEMGPYLDAIRDDIAQSEGRGRIQIYNSEHAVYPPPPKQGNWSQTWWTTHSLGGCLGTALFLVDCLNRPEVGPCSYHCFAGGPWKIIGRDPATGTLYTTGMADLFRVFGRLQGKSVVAVSVDGPETDVNRPDLQFEAGAVIRDDGSLQLLLVNRGGEREAGFSFGTPRRLVESLLFTGPGLKAVDTVDQRPIVLDPGPVTSSAANFAQMVVPSHSVVLLGLRAASPGP